MTTKRQSRANGYEVRCSFQLALRLGAHMLKRYQGLNQLHWERDPEWDRTPPYRIDAGFLWWIEKDTQKS